MCAVDVSIVESEGHDDDEAGEIFTAFLDSDARAEIGWIESQQP